MDTTKLIGLAAQQLRLPLGASQSSIPQSYMTALTKHASAYPNDLNFVTMLQPGTGYGVIYCLEPECRGASIKLTRAAGGDGGMKGGFGTFFEYQKHIRTNEGHVRSRLQRMQGSSVPGLPTSGPAQNSSASQPKSRVSSGSLLSALDNSLGGRPRVATTVRNAPAPPAPSSVPRKRDSDTFDDVVNGVKEEESVDVKPVLLNPSKRQRASLQALSSQPLSPSLANGKARAHPAYIRSADADADNAATIENIKHQIMVCDNWIRANESTVHSLQLGKKKLSKLQSQRLNRLKVTLADMKRTKASALTRLATLQSSAPVPQSAAIKPEPVDYSVKTENTTVHRDVKPGIKREVEPYIKPDVKPDIKPYVQHGAVASGSGSSAGGHNVNTKHGGRTSFGSIDTPSQVLAAKARASLPGSDVLSGVMNQLGELAESEEEDNDALASRLANAIRRGGGGIDEFILAMAGSTFDHNAKVEDGVKKLGLPDINTRLPGMAIKLLPHQVLGVAWMLERERHNDCGGILADEMGLGKTVQTIALMTQNQSDDPARKTTLIVAPLALLSQWKAEIESRTDGNIFKVFIYHGSKDKRPAKKSSLQKYDVVLTTFHTLALENPNYEKMDKARKRRKTDDFIESEDDKQKVKKPGLLVTFPWYRVVLDEAQNIRNRQTHISISVAELDSTYRWCLTGTPITNSLADSYAMFRFLRIRPWNDWTDFREQIYQWERRDPEYASRKLQAIWQVTMLRRKKDSFLDGKPLVQLPSRTVYDDELSFGPEERSIYDFVSHRAQCIFNHFLREGTVLKNYAHVLIMLLRLRQICVHPCLIEEGRMDVFRTPEEMNSMKDREILNEELGRARRELGQVFVGKMMRKLREEMATRIAAEKESIDATIEDDTCPVCFEPLDHEAIVTQCCHSFCDECLDKVLLVPHMDDVNEAIKYQAHERPCPSCRGPISRKHAYKRAAFEPVEKVQNDVDSDDEEQQQQPRATGSRKCKVDGDLLFTPATKSKVNPADGDVDSPDVQQVGKRQSRPRKTKVVMRPIILSDAEDSDDSMDDFIVYSDEDEKSTHRAAKGKGKSAARSRKDRRFKDDDEDMEGSQAEETDDDDDDKRFVSSAPVDMKFVKLPPPESLASFLPSTKMKAMMDLLKKWRKEAPNDKVMIISQWTTVLELCSAYLDENNFKHLIFEGKLSIAQRNERVAKFMGDRKVTVLLMSLKAGGVGLNLTAASRVINLDLAWSNAVENQAFDRVHRLGQQKPVHIHRLIIANTVEARVLELQSRKQSLADGSLGEGTGKRIGRLSVRELAALFGLDARGRVLSPEPCI